jgi:hypothetical protein
MPGHYGVDRFLIGLHHAEGMARRRVGHGSADPGRQAVEVPGNAFASKLVVEHVGAAGVADTQLFGQPVYGRRALHGIDLDQRQTAIGDLLDQRSHDGLGLRDRTGRGDHQADITLAARYGEAEPPHVLGLAEAGLDRADAAFGGSRILDRHHEVTLVTVLARALQPSRQIGRARQEGEAYFTRQVLDGALHQGLAGADIDHQEADAGRRPRRIEAPCMGDPGHPATGRDPGQPKSVVRRFDHLGRLDGREAPEA